MQISGWPPTRCSLELRRYEETHLFLARHFPGDRFFKHDVVYYERKDRQQGETQYSFRKMVRLAIDGITSFSGFPLKMITVIGFTVFIGCFLAILWSYFRYDHRAKYSCWSSITLPTIFPGRYSSYLHWVLSENT
jgi:hypothetical protein